MLECWPHLWQVYNLAQCTGIFVLLTDILTLFKGHGLFQGYCFMWLVCEWINLIKKQVTHVFQTPRRNVTIYDFLFAASGSHILGCPVHILWAVQILHGTRVHCPQTVEISRSSLLVSYISRDKFLHFPLFDLAQHSDPSLLSVWVIK